MVDDTVRRVHAEGIVIDAACPLVMEEPHYLDWYREGGVTIVAPTVGGWDTIQATMSRIGSWWRLLGKRADVSLVRTSSDVEEVKAGGRIGVYFHLQGTDPIEGDLDLVDAYKALGVGVVQLTYNLRNRVGDGCEERTDSGLSRFGERLIGRLNDARVIVDCSHTGERTSLEAIERSSRPVILSHTNSRSVHPSARNASDALIKAIAASGGVVGIAGFPAMVANGSRPSLDAFVAHIDAVAANAGIDHVGLGIDYYWGQAGVAADETARSSYEAAVRSGRWGAAYPPPPHHYPSGIDTPRTLWALTDRLLSRGYRADDVHKVLGRNWLRVMRNVWG